MWHRLGACLSLVAVWAAMFSPVAMLAEEVRTGKLGGICSVATNPAGNSATPGAADGEVLADLHCDWCGGSGVMLAHWLAPVLFPGFGDSAPLIAVAAVYPASTLGLPFSRGPPPLI